MAMTQEYGIGEFDFPHGWFVVAEAKDANNKPIPMRYFRRDPILLITPEDEAAIAAYQDGSRMALMQDFDVWKHKAPCIQIIQVVGDGPLQ